METPKTLERDLIALLEGREALTILKLDEGWMISFSALEEDDEGLIMVPHKVMLSTQSLAEALFSFHVQNLLGSCKGLQA